MLGDALTFRYRQSRSSCLFCLMVANRVAANPIVTIVAKIAILRGTARGCTENEEKERMCEYEM